MIAALFVMTDGPYFGLDGVDPFDVTRDAFTYNGPHKVIAHPPCQLWGKFAAVNFIRWGGSHNRPGNDRGAFAFALQAVRTHGGVLEHPAFSHAWDTFRLVKPQIPGWNKVSETEYVCEVWQNAYGHKARKRTWLLYVSLVGKPPFNLNWAREPGEMQIGFPDKRGKEKNKPTLSGKSASETPTAFRDLLIELVKGSE